MSKSKASSRSHVGATSEREQDLRQALAKIAEVASRAAAVSDYSSEGNDREVEHFHTEDDIVCMPRSLPDRLLMRAAELSAEINPVNAPAFWRRSAFAAGLTPQPSYIAAVTTKYWGPKPRNLTVSFMEGAPSDLRKRILSHMNAWTKTCGISFKETNGAGQVRISREPGGYWSYLGTDILLVSKNQQTMNLEDFSMSTPESEYKRVVRHETGHTLGFPHEHMRKVLVARIEPAKAYAWAARELGWSKQMVDEQILKSLDERSLMATPPDQTSIMCYQLPGSITYDGKPIIGGTDIDANDYAFAGKIYPRVGHTAPSMHMHMGPARDWPESEDVEEVEA